MHFDQIIFHVENAPSLKLLRHEHGAFALSFFFSAFKQQNQVQIKYYELVRQLEAFMAEQAEGTQLPAKITARQLIDQWCDDRHRYVRKYYEADGDEPVTELTYETEQALEWIQSLEKREFVGAESRFLSIFDNLSSLAVKGEADPKLRLSHLQKERERIDKEIQEIKRTGRAQALSGVEVKERFLNIMDETRRLLADFRLIEEIFKDLTRRIKTQILKETSTKGAILGQVLDIHDTLEESDQGKSFRAFWTFLMSAEKQEELKALSQRVLELDEIQEYTSQHAHRRQAETLLTLKAQLLQVGRKVLQSQYRLSKELRRMLHQDAVRENRQVTQTIAAIKRLCLTERDALAGLLSRPCVDLELEPEVRLPLERPLWRLKEEARFSARATSLLGDSTAPPELEPLQTGMGIRLRELEERIEALLLDRDEVELAEVVRIYPVDRGCGELIGYLTLALERSQHRLDPDTSDSIAFVGLGGRGTAVVPRVLFRRGTC